MFESVLGMAGLDPKESLVYEELLRRGEAAPTGLLEKLPIKRGDLYNVLRRLEERKLIQSIPETKKLTYRAVPPDAINQAIKSEERRLEEAKSSLSMLYSLYNFGIGKPNVRFAQGIEGIKEIFNDTLTVKTEIVSYADVDGWMTYLKKYAIWYAAERRARKIKERVIIPDTPAAKEYFAGYNMAVTTVQFIPHQKYKFALEMNVYDNKVSYVTFREPFISVLIEDRVVADTQRAIFELSWAHACALPQPTLSQK